MEHLEKWLQIQQTLYDNSLPKNVILPWLEFLLQLNKMDHNKKQIFANLLPPHRKKIFIELSHLLRQNVQWKQTKEGLVVPNFSKVQKIEVIEVLPAKISPSKKEVPQKAIEKEILLPQRNSVHATQIAPCPISIPQVASSIPHSPTDSFWANPATKKVSQINVAKKHSPFGPVNPSKYTKSSEACTLILPDKKSMAQTPFSNYQIIEKLGKYGPGILYRVLNKESREELVMEEICHKNVRYVLPEVMASALLFHANILPPSQVWLQENTLYIATKYIKGRTLRKYIEEEMPTTDEKVAIVATIGDALCYAHKRGIAHGNLRLSNGIIAVDGTPYLMNFGMGKLYSHKNVYVPRKSTQSYKKLDPNKAIPHLPKMSPKPDIRLFGSVLYEVITSKKFERKSRSKNQFDIPWPKAISPKLKTICLHLLDRKQGYKSLNIAVADMRKYLKICDQEILPLPQDFMHTPKKALAAATSKENRAFIRPRWGLIASMVLLFCLGAFLLISTLPQLSLKQAKEIHKVSAFSRNLVKLHQRNKYSKIQAAKHLGSMGNKAQTGVSQLIFALKDERWEVKKAIFDALVKIDPQGKKIFPLLISILQHKNDLMRKASAEAFDYFYDKVPANIEVEKALVKASSDAYWPVRMYSLKALDKMGALSKVDRSILLKRAKDTHWAVRKNAVEILGRMGLNTSWAIKYLATALKDPNKSVRKVAIERISKIGGPRGTDAIPVLLEMIKRGDFSQQNRTLKVLGKITPISPKAIPILIAALKEHGWMIKRYAKEALSQIDSRAKGTMNAFMEVLKKENHHIRAYIVIAIGKMKPKKPVMVPALIYALDDISDFVRKRAADSLRDYGPLAITALPFLTKALNDKSFWVRQSAEEAIKRIKGH